MSRLWLRNTSPVSLHILLLSFIARCTLNIEEQNAMTLAEQVLKTVLSTLCIFMLARGISAAVTVSRTDNRTLFLGTDDFDRICSYSGSSDTFVQLEWLRNGQSYKNSTAIEFHLTIPTNELTIEHAGEYTCRARHSDGTTEEPVSAGFLIIYNPAWIIAPPIQYALINEDFTLQCSSNFTEHVIYQWSREGEIVLMGLRPRVQISDEGQYVCRTYLSAQDIDFEKTVELRVIVPPQILSHPQVDDETYSNEPVTLSVQFQSRFEGEGTTLVSWYRDDTLIPESRIETRDETPPNATTSLQFTPITRSDRGRYRVVIENPADVIPEELRQTQVEFNVHVSVAPTRPSNPLFSILNDTHVTITWTLTNQTPDAGPTQLFLNLDGHPSSPVELEPTQLIWNLVSEPGMRYNVSLTAMNPDGMATTEKISFEIPPTAPLVTSFKALRLNSSAFNFTLNVQYTGGGDITEFAIRIREIDSTDWIPLEAQVTPTRSSALSRQSWFAVVVNSLFEEIKEAEFEVVVRNAREKSTGTMVVRQQLVFPSPSSLTIISKSHDTLTIELLISDKGTTPITDVIVAIIDPLTLAESMNKTGAFNLEERVSFVFTGLEPDTTYTLVGYVNNVAGQSPVSEETIVMTDSTPSPLPLPAWAYIVIAVVVSVVLTSLIVLLIVCCCCRNRRKNGGKYNAGSANSKFYTDHNDVDVPDDAPSEVTISSRGFGYSGYARSDGRLTPRILGNNYDRYHSPIPRNHSPYFPQYTDQHMHMQQHYNITKSPLLTSYSNHSEYKRDLESSMDGSVEQRSVVLHGDSNDYPRYVVEQSPGPVSVPPTVGPVLVPTAQVPAPLQLSKSLPLLDDTDPDDQLSPPHTASYATDV